MLTAFAGLSTGIGSTIAFFSRTTNRGFLAISLGFSAGVMIFVSFVEIYAKANEALAEVHGDVQGKIYTVLAFFSGIAVIMIIDKLIPSVENPHDPPYSIEEAEKRPEYNKKLMRMGLFTALAIAIHNFPEGLATFTSALSDPALGISIAIAIAIHNIPEGIAVSIPIYYATNNRKKAFWYSFLSGISEPIGAIIGYTLLKPFFNQTTFGLLFGSVAGIMVFISLDELLPTAREHDAGHKSVYGMIAGMAVMAISLILFM
jgi:ZIP family zinc transporter